MLDNSVDCCPRIVRLCIHTNTDFIINRHNYYLILDRYRS